MTQNCEKIKTLLEQLSTAHIPASARLIAVLQELGIEAPSDLERLSGLRPSSVRLAKKQITEQRQPASAAGQRSPLARQPASAAGQRSSRARAYKESPSEIVITKKDSPLTPQGGFDDPHNSEGVELDANGRVTLVNGVRQFWLDQFGGDVERLSLALLQVSVQPNSRRPIRAQVESQLARQASQRRDQDARYSAAVKSNPRNKPPPDTLEGHYTAPLPDKPLVPVLDEWR